jgi:O-antigen/teichoic acid export membrane protein
LTRVKHNVIASYASQLYMAAIGILLVPIYLRYMGAEAYGLIGFYSMLQGWFMLLDVGLTPTMIRETARFRGGSLDALTLRRFVRTLEGIFYAIAIVAAVVVIAASHFIASDWLKVQKLSLREVKHVVILIAGVMAMRWISSLYKGSVNGFERLVWLGAFNIIIATLRFVVVIPVFLLFGASPTVYFSYQLLIAIVELTFLFIQLRRLLPKTNPVDSIAWDWTPLKSVLGFSLTIAFTNAAWVVVTQTDKLLLSKFLPLSEYGYFTLAVLVASGVTLLGSPMNNALLPRMVKLQAEGDEAGLVRIYRDATQVVTVIAIPASLVLAFFSYPILLAWTNNPVASREAAPILTLYAIGNGILALSTFPYSLQFAKGDLKLHLIGSGMFILVLIPLLIWGTRHYGMVGAGYAWLFTNALLFIFWVPKIHSRFVKGLHSAWLLHDIAGIALFSFSSALLMRHFIHWPDNRLRVALLVAMLSGALVLVAAAASSWVRRTFLHKIPFFARFFSAPHGTSNSA